MFCVKDNQETLRNDIEDYVQDDSLRKTMDTIAVAKKTATESDIEQHFSTCDIQWLYGLENWEGLACIGAVNEIVTTKKRNDRRMALLHLESLETLSRRVTEAFTSRMVCRNNALAIRCAFQGGFLPS